jgi:fructan beta-fructosidase
VECLVAIYTRHRRLPDGRINQTQDLAFSNDRGRTWIKYDGNPVLDLPDESFRDPKVFWHAGTQRWIMAITLPEQRRIAIFSSPDLKAWTRQSTFGPHGASQGRWECPDLVQVPIRGRPGITRWVMKVDVAEGDVAGGGGAQYWVGTFDGVTFEPMEPEDLTNVLWLDYGKDFYCAHRFYDAPGTVDNPFWIGWMNDWLYAPDLPSFPWKGTMSLPRTLDLVEEPEGLRLAQTPVASLQRLRAERSSFSAAGVDELNAQIQARRLSLDGFEMRVTIEPGAADVVGVRLREAVPFGAQPPGEIAAALGYDFASNEVFMARPEAGNVEVAPEFAGTFRGPLEEPEGSVRLRVFVDRNSVEIFSADGRTTMTNLMFPLNPVERLEFYTEGGAAGSIEVDIWPMRSAWLPESLFPFPD